MKSYLCDTMDQLITFVGITTDETASTLIICHNVHKENQIRKIGLIMKLKGSNLEKKGVSFIPIYRLKLPFT